MERIRNAGQESEARSDGNEKTRRNEQFQPVNRNYTLNGQINILQPRP